MARKGGFHHLFRGAVLAVLPASVGVYACSSDDGSPVSEGSDAAVVAPEGGCPQPTLRLFDSTLLDASADASCEDGGEGRALVCPSPVLPGDGGNLYGLECNPYCGAGYYSCYMADAGLASCSKTSGCVGGRRPERYAGDSQNSFFETMTGLEAASVLAFERLARELEAHGAPADLVRAARRARVDEIRHAKITTELARRFGGAPQTIAVELGAVRCLEAIALENAIEGCVRETMGALIAAWQAERASDEVVRAAMKKIARDEARHAELAFQVAAWIDERLDADQRARVEIAKNGAIAELLENWSDPSLDLQTLTGLPTRSEARALFERVAPSLGLA